MPASVRAFAVLTAMSLALAACGSSGSDQPPAPACGDRTISAGEACDDGNTTAGDGCSATCLVESGYACTGQPSACSASCGNGLVGVGEQCDDGNDSNADACLNTCTVASCGDGVVRAGVEQCDDGNSLPGDGCDATCQVESGYACTGQPSACSASCGNGLVGGGEQCDDGNATAGDGCAPTCQVEGGYACTGQPSVCTTACGDGLVGGAEQCDDGNFAAGDGCAATCQVEGGFTCTGEPSVCSTLCGDGLVAGAEACDDGNFSPGDGCDATCQVEGGFTCTGQPSACVQSVQQVDAWVPGASPTFQAGFVAGEAAAVKLGPLPRAVTVTAVRLLFGGAAGTQTVTLRIYQDQGVAAPGAVLFEGDYQLTAADTAMQELALSVAVPAGQAFRLAVFWQHAGAPSIARDDGTSAAGANWVFLTPDWLPWSAVSATGNFILRAVVE